VAGLLGAPLVSLTTGSPTPLVVLALGVPIVLLSFALAWGWIERGRLSAAVPARGLVVLFVNLMAAGGIGYTAVAESFWLLLALGLGACVPHRLRTIAMPLKVLLLVLAIALAVACYMTGYQPVLESQAAMAHALREPAQAQAALEMAAVADPFAARPRLELAGLALREWQTHRDPQQLQQFERNLAQALRLAPGDHTVWLIAGDWYFDAFSIRREKRLLEHAVDCYRNAAELYPNSALVRAKWAVALATAGQAAEFRPQAAEALRLDRLTPHEDKKLPAELRRRLEAATP
jgi:tetratricopeptide (TPR) repeat protein